MNPMDCIRFYTMEYSQFGFLPLPPFVRRTLLCLFFLLPVSSVEAQIKQGTYASINTFERVCLKLTDQQRFEMFSSNCTIDRDFVGDWKYHHDTLVLQSDNGPAMTVLGATETSGSGSEATILLKSRDPQLLRGISVKSRHDMARQKADGTFTINHPIDSIYFVMEGLRPQLYIPVDPNVSLLTVELLFQNLDKPALVNDSWLVDGKKLHYLPGSYSSRSSSIELKRGKRCFYKQ